jgi:hypothetical protein
MIIFAVAMYELHENEQYFFDQSTLDHLSSCLGEFSDPCCLCAPLLGQALVKKGISVTILDIDDRFSQLAGFFHYDLHRPKWLGRKFGVILCDPPFYKLSLSQLFAAIRMLSCNDFHQPLLISFLRRRAANVINTFCRFRINATGYFPSYQTVQHCEKNEIEFFSNLDNDAIEKLVKV